VSVSPVLVLPRHAFEGEESQHCTLINYLITGPNTSSNESSSLGNISDVALLPLTQAGMMNHGAGAAANIEMDWYDVSLFCSLFLAAC
jgi:hypothetical protein